MQTCSERLRIGLIENEKVISKAMEKVLWSTQGPDIKEVENTEIQEGKSSFKLK